MKRVLEREPDNSSAHYNLAVAYNSKGLFTEAIREYEEGLRINPYDNQAMENITKLRIIGN